MKANALHALFPTWPPSLESLSGFSRPLTDMLSLLELSPAGLHCLRSVDDAMEGLRRLLAAGLMEEAVRVAAHALPKRHAVWWACLCTRAMPMAPSVPEVDTALLAAERWVMAPGEAHRRAGMDIAQRIGFQHAESWLAMAAFWSGGSMAPLDHPPVLPPDHLTGVAVVSAIVLAAARQRPEQASRRMGRCVEAAIATALGEDGRSFLDSL